MRKIILWMSISLDGFFAGPDGELDWHRVDEELHQHFNDELRRMSAFLDGRRTYELMADFWPTADQDPAASAPTREFAGIWRDMPKIVYSRTLPRADWNSTVVGEVVPEEVMALKAQPGGDMVLGGADLAATFQRLGLIDEYRIYVHPVVIGRGRPLFTADARLDLRLAESRPFGNGVVLLRYLRSRRDRAPGRPMADGELPDTGPAAVVPATWPPSLAGFAEPARSALAPEVWDFVNGGSGTEITLTANRAALDRVAVLPRVLTGVDRPCTEASLLGRPQAMPVAVAPMAYQRLVHPDGEPALAAAAGAAGVPYVASTLGSTPIEEVAAAGDQVWFQLYWLRDRGMVADLLDRAHAAGCSALMVTVDVPVLGRRLRDVRNGFALPPHVTTANLPGGRDDLAHQGTPGVSAVPSGAVFAPALSWADLEWLRGRTPLPLLVKGILDPRDAVRAAETGVDAVVVSNHGGRQLDGAPATATVLPEVVAAVGKGCEVLLDSGVRGGIDVLRALALGAAGVLVGRPMLWALAAGGRAGAEAALALLAAELRDALTLTGCADPAAARHLRTITET